MMNRLHVVDLAICRNTVQLSWKLAADPSTAMQGFEKTGLGRRVATIFVKWFGKSTLGLAYGLAAAEALLAPAMPSTTARAGGIFMPIINSLSRSAGSMPGETWTYHLSISQLGLRCNRPTPGQAIMFVKDTPPPPLSPHSLSQAEAVCMPLVMPWAMQGKHH